MRKDGTKKTERISWMSQTISLAGWKKNLYESWYDEGKNNAWMVSFIKNKRWNIIHSLKK